MDDAPKKPRKVEIKANEELSMGRYSNTMFIAHGPEEFIIDWLLNSASGAHLVSRIIVTPGHIKRIISTLTENLKRYEEKFGEIKLADPPEHQFH